MTDEHVLNMPARRFWCLERQINRIMSHEDLREINVNRATADREQMQEVVERLTLEIGETAKVHINAIVKPEPNAGAKLREAMKL